MTRHHDSKKKTLTCLLSLTLLAGCLDGGGSSSNKHSRGQLNPSGIEGLSYQTASKTGTTNSEGSFYYYEGETLTFRVGDLPLADGVPADDLITPLEFYAGIRAQLETASVNDEGLLDHRITEQAALNDNALLNMTRFLLALNWSESVKEGEGIDIRPRVIEQLNAALPSLASEIDFSVTPETFEYTGSLSDTADDADRLPSPANALLAEICFYDEADERCGTPPTQAEIDAAPDRPIEEDDRDPDIDYKEDLTAKRERINNAKRNMKQFTVQEAREYLTWELDAATRRYANRYYLGSETASHPASDTSIHTVHVRRIGSSPSLGALEAVSLRETDVTIHSYDWQSATVEYFLSGPSGGESDLLINFRPDDDYRWLKKQIRVVIE